MSFPPPERRVLTRLSLSRLAVSGGALAAALAAVSVSPRPVGGQIPAVADTQRTDTNLGRHSPVGPCSLGTRLGLTRPEGACLRARETHLPTTPRAYLPPGRRTVRLVPVEVQGAWRSAYPSDRHDGLLWSGRGFSGSLSGGIQAHWGPLTAVLAPQVARSENRAFALPDTTSPGWSRYADPWVTPGLDRYLRPGEGVVTWWGWGESYIQAEAGPVMAGVSNERLWWGPARRYPLLFSGTAPGFPHLYAESAGEIPLLSGGVSLRALTGRLLESRWFDADAENDERMISAGQVAWRAGFVPGLELALSMVHHHAPGGAPSDASGSTLGTVSFRVAIPDEGIEAYGEVGRGAFFTNGIAGVSETANAQIYTLGMTRSDVSPGGLRWVFWGELTKQALELPQPAASGAQLSLRAPTLPHGHTNRGQFLGSWTGPGSNAQSLGLDFPGDVGTLGVFAERVRRDDDTYYRIHQVNHGVFGYDLEWTLGARGGHSFSLGPGDTVQLHAEGGISRRKNRSFVGLDRGKNWTWVREWNPWMDVRLVWIPE